jgi:peptidoglycan/LPS O-acetylase OafA/YrhL
MTPATETSQPVPVSASEPLASESDAQAGGTHSNAGVQRGGWTADAVWRPGVHVPQLDGVRGLAIALVTCYRFGKEFPTDSTLGWFLSQSFRFGDRGVDLFFVLSGFLITGILYDSRHEAHYLRNFMARRCLRIFPLYFVAVGLFLTVGYWLQPAAFAAAKENQIYLWTYTTNIKMSLEGSWCFGSLDHFWSLAVEEHFYLVWPLVIWCCRLPIALWLTTSLAVLCGFARITFAGLSDNGVAPDVATFFRCDALLIGAAVALLIRTPQGLDRLRRIAIPVIVGALVAGLGFVALERRLWTISHTIWPLFWMGMLTLVLTCSPNSPVGRLFAMSSLRSLGKYSYAMYVFQNPLIPLMAGVFGGTAWFASSGPAWLQHLLYMMTMFALTYAVAVFSWYAFETHFLKLKKYFASPRKVAGALDLPGQLPASGRWP